MTWCRPSFSLQDIPQRFGRPGAIAGIAAGARDLQRDLPDLQRDLQGLRRLPQDLRRIQRVAPKIGRACINFGQIQKRVHQPINALQQLIELLLQLPLPDRVPPDLRQRP